MRLQVTVDVPMTVEQLAGLFVELDDDTQARFFVEVASLMQSWSATERWLQADYIGKHLRNCTCSTEEARELVSTIYEAMTRETAKTEAERALDDFLSGAPMSEFAEKGEGK